MTKKWDDHQVKSGDEIKKSLDDLKKSGIKFEYKMQGSKFYAVIKLTNGCKIMFCCFTRELVYKNKTYNKKNKSVSGLVRFIENNKFEVKK